MKTSRQLPLEKKEEKLKGRALAEAKQFNYFLKGQRDLKQRTHTQISIRQRESVTISEQAKCYDEKRFVSLEDPGRLHRGEISEPGLEEWQDTVA